VAGTGGASCKSGIAAGAAGAAGCASHAAAVAGAQRLPPPQPPLLQAEASWQQAVSANEPASTVEEMNFNMVLFLIWKSRLPDVVSERGCRPVSETGGQLKVVNCVPRMSCRDFRAGREVPSGAA